MPCAADTPRPRRAAATPPCCEARRARKMHDRFAASATSSSPDKLSAAPRPLEAVCARPAAPRQPRACRPVRRRLRSRPKQSLLRARRTARRAACTNCARAHAACSGCRRHAAAARRLPPHGARSGACRRRRARAAAVRAAAAPRRRHRCAAAAAMRHGWAGGAVSPRRGGGRGATQPRRRRAAAAAAPRCCGAAGCTAARCGPPAPRSRRSSRRLVRRHGVRSRRASLRPPRAAARPGAVLTHACARVWRAHPRSPRWRPPRRCAAT